jgi:hypothetical protein
MIAVQHLTTAWVVSSSYRGFGGLGDAVRYCMMRLFLTSRAEGTMFEALPPQKTRGEYLAQVFGSDHVFRYWQKNYVYKAFPDKAVDAFVLGVIAHEHTPCR